MLASGAMLAALLPAGALAQAQAPAGATGPTGPSGATGGPALPYSAQAPTQGSLYLAGPSGRYLLGGTWLFRFDDGVGLAQRFQDSASTAGWQQVIVPNAWNATDQTLASFVGTVAWYRKDFTLPSKALQWIVRFESVNYDAIVWLNGHRLGSHDGAFLPFEFALPASDLHHGANRLVIRVSNQGSATTLPPLGVSPTSGLPVGGWWNYGGILREVYLRHTGAVDFSSVQVLPRLACSTCAARVDVRVTLHNYARSAQRVALGMHFGATHATVGTRTIAPGQSAAYSRTITLAHPVLWSPGHPYLYPVTLDAGGGATYFLQSGIRSIVVSPDGQLLLNGQPLHFRGVGLIEDSLSQGSALSNAQRAALVAAAKDVGATVIRTQYPADPYLEQLADQMGLMLWSEIPVYQVKQQYIGDITPAALEMLRENITDNGNHPSVIIWSVGNELSPSVAPTQAAYIAQAATTAHRLDPTRPVAIAVAGDPAFPCQDAYGPLQVIGVNDYFGWYVGVNGDIADPTLLPSYLDQERACYPHKALVVSEFGAEASQNGPVEVRGTYAYQQAFINGNLSVFASKPYLSGAIWWALSDFRVRPGWAGGNPAPNPPIFQKGLLDFSGSQTPAYAEIKAGFAAVRQLG